VNNEKHRELSLAAYQAYEEGTVQIASVRLSELAENQVIEKAWWRTVYFLRLDPLRTVHISVKSISNRDDAQGVLYIGGHGGGVGGARYNKLIESCRRAEAHFETNGFAKNDQWHMHQVAGYLTTALMQTGFRIKDCIIDVVSGAPDYDELEFIIGYQEKFHHLPPWNSRRDGSCAFAG
jgi:hypothetical protein